MISSPCCSAAAGLKLRKDFDSNVNYINSKRKINDKYETKTKSKSVANFGGRSGIVNKSIDRIPANNAQELNRSKDGKNERKNFCKDLNNAENIKSNEENSKNKVLESCEKFGKEVAGVVIKNPGKTAATLAGSTYLVSFAADKISSAFRDDNRLLLLLENFVMDSDAYRNFNINKLSEFEKVNLGNCLNDKNLKFLYCLCKEFRRNLKDDDGNPKDNYSLFRTASRRFVDAFLFGNGAVTRQRKSVERYLGTQKGTCWEAALIFDFCCRMFNFKEHNIVASVLRPGIYHTFNYFVYNGEKYLCDPLNRLFSKIIVKDNSIGDFIIDYLNEAQRVNVNAGLPYFQGYILQQIDSDTKRPLGMVKMARFLSPRWKLWNREFYDNGGQISDSNDFLRVNFCGGNNFKVVFNSEENVKFNKCSTFLFG